MISIAFITPNNFNHKAGDGLATRKHGLSDIHPALQANAGATQATYILIGDDKAYYNNRKVFIC